MRTQWKDEEDDSRKKTLRLTAKPKKYQARRKRLCLQFLLEILFDGNVQSEIWYTRIDNSWKRKRLLGTSDNWLCVGRIRRPWRQPDSYYPPTAMEIQRLVTIVEPKTLAQKLVLHPRSLISQFAFIWKFTIFFIQLSTICVIYIRANIMIVKFCLPETAQYNYLEHFQIYAWCLSLYAVFLIIFVC